LLATLKSSFLLDNFVRRVQSSSNINGSDYPDNELATTLALLGPQYGPTAKVDEQSQATGCQEQCRQEKN